MPSFTSIIVSEGCDNVAPPLFTLRRVGSTISIMLIRARITAEYLMIGGKLIIDSLVMVRALECVSPLLF